MALDTSNWRFSILLSALSVRALLVLHNILAVWRVVISRDDQRYWSLAAANLLTLIETGLVLLKNGGHEWKWWCPCFLSYLLTTFPSIWLLQLSQYDLAVAGGQVQGQNISATVIQSQRLVMTTPNMLDATSNDVTDDIRNSTTAVSQSTPESSTTFIFFTSIDAIIGLTDKTWIVVIQESLVYLIVFGRWILPRADVSRKDLSDLLLEYLAMASDIMELYALFDESAVQENLGVTYAILAVWSLSFMQFIPILVQKKNRWTTFRMQRITRACGHHFPEVVVTCTSIFLQDGPFLCLRLYIIIEFQLITYSLVFFTFKNIVSVLLLCYRLVVLCVRLPCCYKTEGVLDKIESVDFSLPIVIIKTKPMYDFSKETRSQLGAL